MIPFRHVLAPLDLTSSCRHTARQAVATARACDATLTLLHVVPREGDGGALAARRWEILCSVELAKNPAPVIAVAAALARAQRSHLTVVHTIGAKSHYLRSGLRHRGERARLRRETEEARAQLLTLLAAVSRSRPEADAVVSLDRADEETLRIALDLRASLIVTAMRAEPRRVGASWDRWRPPCCNTLHAHCYWSERMWAAFRPPRRSLRHACRNKPVARRSYALSR